MDTILEVPTWIVDNAINADILLPKPSLDSPARQLLPIGGWITADAYLLSALGRKVRIRDMRGSSAAEPALQLTRQSEPTPQLLPKPSAPVNATEMVIAKWHQQFGSRFVRASELLPIVRDVVPPWFKSAASAHTQLIMLGRYLRSLTTGDQEWGKIIVRERAHTSEYSVCPVQTNVE